MALYSVRLSPSHAACEPACGVDVLLGRFVREPASVSSRVDLIRGSAPAPGAAWG